jgi:hypothetical protein
MATTQEKYQNLPGVKVTYEDGNLYTGNSTLSANTQSILVIGSAVDGPVGVPISVKDVGIKAAEKMFGGLIDRQTKEPIKASLIRGMYEALRAGNEDVRLLRIDGKSAKTILKAKDLARTMEQFLDYAKGNTSFGMDVKVPTGGTFVAVTSVSEVDATDKTIVLNPTSTINYVDQTIPGAEKVFFYENKMRPGNNVKIGFDYETRTYTLVPKADSSGAPDYTDPDYTLTRDTQNTHYFYSARKNWSDQLISGHVPTVTVKDNVANKVYTIPSTNASGEYIYRVGKAAVTDPLHDVWKNAEGGILFTSAYDAEVAKGTYPNITGNVSVTVEYAWFVAMPNHGETTTLVPGTANMYDLSYTPMTDGFGVFYVDNGVQVDLAAGKDFSISQIDKKVTINAGVAPVGAQISARYKTSTSTVTDPQLVVEGKYPGRSYGSLIDIYDKESIRGVRVQVDLDATDPKGLEKIITFTKPEEKRLTYKDTTLVYKTKDMPRTKTLRQFINLVNSDPMNNIVFLSCDNAFGSVPIQGLLPVGEIYLGQVTPGVLKEDPSKPQNTPDRYPWLGDDGMFDTDSETDMQRLWDKLGGKYDTNIQGDAVLVEQGIYSKIENYVCDEIVLMDAFYNSTIDTLSDTPAKNFATQLAQHCAIVTAKTWEVIGFIGVAPAPNSDLVSVQNYIDDLTRPGSNEHYMYNEATLDYVLNDQGDKIDIGRYVNVVFGPEISISQEKIGPYVAGGTATYAALTSTLNAEVATTNKQVPGVLGLRYILSEAQHNQLVGGRYVTFDQKVIAGSNGYITRIVVKDGVTAALATSDYTRLSTVRIVHASVQVVRRKADPYIGMPNGLAQQNALYAEIQSALDKLKELGVIQRFKFEIYSSAQDKVLGNAFITLELVPQFEVRKFMTSVVLRAA